MKHLTYPLVTVADTYNRFKNTLTMNGEIFFVGLDS